MKKLLLLVVAAALGIQLIRTERTNPPVEADLYAPPAVKALLRRACYDCHSHETVWPWYAGVAPVSWLVAHDVKEAREHMNFSRWTSLRSEQQEHKKQEIWEEIESGHMPPWYYVRLHAEAELTNEDLSTLRGWIKPEYRVVPRTH